MEIKWVTMWESKSLRDVPSIKAYDSVTYLNYLQKLMQEVGDNDYYFSGEGHVYGKGVPLFYDGRNPIGKFECEADEWAKFMYHTWRSKLDGKYLSLRFRTDFLLPKEKDIKYPC